MARYVQQAYYFQGSPLLLERYFSIIIPGTGEISGSPRKGWGLAEGHRGSEQQGGSRAWTKTPGQLPECADPPGNMAQLL